MLQIKGGESLRIKDLDEGFQEGLRDFQAGGEELILLVVYIGKEMSLRRSLRRGSTTEVLNRGLDTLVIETNNRFIKREGWRVERVGGLSSVAMYTQVENALGMHLRYSRIL